MAVERTLGSSRRTLVRAVYDLGRQVPVLDGIDPVVKLLSEDSFQSFLR